MSISDLLKSVPLFAGLTDGELTVLEALLEFEEVPAGQVIIKQDELGRSLYIISEGSVSITRTTPGGHTVTLGEVRRGEVLGELSALDAGPRSADATATENCQMLVLRRESFVQFVQKEPQAAVTLMVTLLTTLSQRLRRTDEIVYKNEVSRLEEWNEQMQRAMHNMTEMNTAFRHSLSHRFEVIFAHQELISDIERLSDKAASLARGSSADLGAGMSDLAYEMRSLAASARLKNTN